MVRKRKREVERTKKKKENEKERGKNILFFKVSFFRIEIRNEGKKRN